jgi:hypothetical protein
MAEYTLLRILGILFVIIFVVALFVSITIPYTQYSTSEFNCYNSIFGGGVIIAGYYTSSGCMILNTLKLIEIVDVFLLLIVEYLVITIRRKKSNHSANTILKIKKNNRSSKYEENVELPK